MPAMQLRLWQRRRRNTEQIVKTESNCDRRAPRLIKRPFVDAHLAQFGRVDVTLQRSAVRAKRLLLLADWRLTSHALWRPGINTKRREGMVRNRRGEVVGEMKNSRHDGSTKHSAQPVFRTACYCILPRTESYRNHLELLDRKHHDTTSPCCWGLLHD